MRNRLLLHPTRGPLHLSGLLLAACLGGCQEEEAAQSPSLLVGGWRVVKVEFDTPETTWTVIQDCHSDDVFEYTLNGRYARYPGSVLCGGVSEPYVGYWRVSEDEKTLFIRYDIYFGEFETEIVSLDENRVVIIADPELIDGGRYRYTQERVWGL
jgi:hypothetical protein